MIERVVATDEDKQAIVHGLKQRIEDGVIPTVDEFKSESAKMEEASPIVTDEGLKLRVYASKRARGVEKVVILIEDLGHDIELRSLLRINHGNSRINGIGIGMYREFNSDRIGEGMVLNPSIETLGGTFIHTYTYVSPKITQALVNRIPLNKPKV